MLEHEDVLETLLQLTLAIVGALSWLRGLQHIEHSAFLRIHAVLKSLARKISLTAGVAFCSVLIFFREAKPNFRAFASVSRGHT